MVMTSEDINKKNEAMFFTSADIARMLGRSEHTVMRFFREKKLPGLKIGGTWFISKEDWYAFLEKEKNR